MTRNFEVIAERHDYSDPYFVSHGTGTICTFQTAADMFAWWESQDSESRYFCRLYDVKTGENVTGARFMWMTDAERREMFHDVESVATEEKLANEKKSGTPRKVSISAGNRKTGAIPSVSLPPVVTCADNCPCAKKCYAVKMCRIYKNVKTAYERNLEILNNNPNLYWQQVNEAVKMNRYFRFHVSGDIPGPAYFCNMVSVAAGNPHCEILAFTKCYDIVNDYISQNGPLPKNLHIIFSLWDPAWNVRVHNPHDLPKSAVIFNGQTGDEYEKICGGNCFECACKGTGCWTLKNGETIAFYEH